MSASGGKRTSSQLSINELGNQPQDARAPSALALALKRRRPDLIAALIANGAKMTGQTQLTVEPVLSAYDQWKAKRGAH